MRQATAQGSEPRPELDHAVVLRSGALGDFVLTLPVLSALRERVEHLTVIAPPRYGALFKAADRWIDDDDLRLFSGRLPLQGAVGLAWTASGAEALTACGASPVVAGSPRPAPAVHMADQLWRPLTALGFSATRDRDPTLPPSTPLPGSLGKVVIAPGSGGASKRWPLPRWRAVARALGERALWIGGPLEAGEAGWGQPRRDLLTLEELIAAAQGCVAWLGVDSGPSHLAAAAGARVGVLFTGATDPRQWAPIGAQVFEAEVAPEALARWALEAHAAR